MIYTLKPLETFISRNMFICFARGNSPFISGIVAEIKFQ